MTHPGQIAARMSHSPKLAARESGLTQAQVRAIRDLQSVRRERRRGEDPLLLAQASRPFRTRAAVAAREATGATEKAQMAKRLQREEARAQQEVAIRETLLAAAREARKMGFAVRSSKDRQGRISSYYLQLEDGRAIRISDHEIPETGARLMKAQDRGQCFYSGYHGPQILIDVPRRAIWLRRAIVLAAAGRM